MHAGRAKHGYIKKLMDKYEAQFKSRFDVKFEKTFSEKEGLLKGRFDVIDTNNKVVCL